MYTSYLRRIPVHRAAVCIPLTYDVYRLSGMHTYTSWIRQARESGVWCLTLRKVGYTAIPVWEVWTPMPWWVRDRCFVVVSSHLPILLRPYGIFFFCFTAIFNWHGLIVSVPSAHVIKHVAIVCVWIRIFWSTENAQIICVLLKELWSVDEVGQFIAELGFPDYSAVFVSNDIGFTQRLC